MNENIIGIDTIFLFQRISLAIDSKKDIETYLQYELASFPLSFYRKCQQNQYQLTNTFLRYRACRGRWLFTAQSNLAEK